MNLLVAELSHSSIMKPRVCSWSGLKACLLPVHGLGGHGGRGRVWEVHEAEALGLASAGVADDGRMEHLHTRTAGFSMP